MWSSSSTSRAFLLCTALTLCGGMLTGCGLHREALAPPPAVRGTADLDVLVRRHPGWRGVAQFDGALARLRTAQTETLLPSDPTLLSLPTEAASAPALPPAVLEAQRGRLLRLQAVQVARLRARRARARELQMAALRAGWLREAEAQYAEQTRAAQRTYGRSMRAALEDAGTRRLNLGLQIRALQKTISNWKLSVPPTPALNQAKTELAQKQAKLAALETTQSGALAVARTARDTALAAALADRDAFVEARAIPAEARLQAQDDALAAVLERRLSAQRTALLTAPQFAPGVPAAGALAGESVAPGPSPSTLSAGAAARTASRLGEARARLLTQRTRWVAFLRDDTRAAALDAARQHHWTLAFGPPRAGTTDLTTAVGQTLTRDVWKG